jgi:CheY-like chemotaxis protein
MKILVVHRQKEVIDQIKLVLSNAEPVIRFSDSGLDGLLMARIESFDLIISGTDLPVITGFELIRSIKTNSVNKNTPVVFLSDQVDAKTEHLGHALGVSGLFTMTDFNARLPLLVNQQIKNEPNTYWKDILFNRGLN